MCSKCHFYKRDSMCCYLVLQFIIFVIMNIMSPFLSSLEVLLLYRTCRVDG